MPPETAESRQCPNCGKAVKADATLCGYCWTKSEPLISRRAETSGAEVKPLNAALSGSSEAGSELRPSEGRQISARPINVGYEIHSPQYPALDTIGSIYAALGWLLIIGGALLGFISAALASRLGSGAAFVAALASLLAGVILGLPMLAFRDVIRWMLDLQGHARRSEELLSRLVRG